MKRAFSHDDDAKKRGRATTDTSTSTRATNSRMKKLRRDEVRLGHNSFTCIFANIQSIDLLLFI